MDDIVKKLAWEAFWVAAFGAFVGVIFLSSGYRACCGDADVTIGRFFLPALVFSLAVADQVRQVPFVVGVVFQFLGVWYPLRLTYLLVFPPQPPKFRPVPYGDT